MVVTSVNGQEGDVSLALDDLTDVSVGAATDDQLLAYNSGTWGPVDAASLSVDVDLGYTPAADKGTVTNNAGDDAVIPLRMAPTLVFWHLAIRTSSMKSPSAVAVAWRSTATSKQTTAAHSRASLVAVVLM